DHPVDLRNARTDGGFSITAEGHLAFKDLVDELLHHVLAALLCHSVLAKATLRDDLVQERYLCRCCLRFGGLHRHGIHRATHSCPPPPCFPFRRVTSSVLPSSIPHRTGPDRAGHFPAGFRAG